MFSFSKRKIFDEMTPKIKGKHVLICCTGPSIADYKERIYDLASQEDVIVWGVNNAHPFIDLDVHIWGEWSRWKKFHARVRKESIFLFPPLGKYRKVIAKWDFRSKARTVYYYDYRETGPKEPLRFENFCMHGHFANTGSISIYLSYLLGARKISVVGMDGYITGNKYIHYSKERLTERDENEHRINDKISARFLKLASEAKIPFKIMTPTLFTDYASDEWLNSL